VKEELPISYLLNRLGSGPTTILTSYYDGRSNLMACASAKPANPIGGLVMVSVNRGSFTHHLIKNSDEFALNIPTVRLIEEVEKCGTYSGRHVDKVSETSLTLATAKAVRAPLIDECIGHIECKVSGCYPAEQYDVFIARVVRVSGYKEAFGDYCHISDEAFQTLHYVSGGRYLVVNRTINMSRST
jgi:flavin reductase (DIM6/NTAB) family NADH-FMN oxidoreductase RutF